MVAFYMNCVSTHQLPLAREIAALVGADNFTYIYEGEGSQAYQRVADVGDVVVKRIGGESRCRAELEDSDLLLSGLRDLELFERRAKKGMKTFYTSERWFKPRLGALRMLVPSYRKMVKRFVKWANMDPNARVLAIGPWAKKDFLRMGVRTDKIIPWGYFVEPSTSQAAQTSRTSHTSRTLRVLWAGRDIPLKHVKDIERAVLLANRKLTSTVQPQTSNLQPISFTKLTGVSPAEVRAAMRSHDTFVFASNGYEGWGAVVSEALEEGMNVICSSDCGAGPTLLPRARLFKCGDIGALAKLLEAEYRGELPPCSIGEWTAKKAANKLINME